VRPTADSGCGRSSGPVTVTNRVAIPSIDEGDRSPEAKAIWPYFKGDTKFERDRQE
jgi:hypothetical protein